MNIKNLLFILALLPSWALAQNVKILETDPPEWTSLNANEPLYVRVSYQSDNPARFQARGYLDGSEVEKFFNPAPLYQAGNGEAVVWFSHHKQVDINEVRIAVSGENGETLYAASIPVGMQWNGIPALNWREPADWVRRLLNLEYGAGPRDAQPQEHKQEAKSYPFKSTHFTLYWVLQLAVLLAGGLTAWWLDPTSGQRLARRGEVKGRPAAKTGKASAEYRWPARGAGVAGRARSGSSHRDAESEGWSI